jgi:micrococcal nuclease
MRRFLGIGSVAAALVALALGPASAGAVTLSGHVTDVVDGDTIKVEVRGAETTVRLIGVDTPETKRPGTPVECFGPAASARTARLLAIGSAVRLATDPTQDTRDRYGRLLAYVYRAGHRTSVNYALVATGYARAYVYGETPFRYASAYLRAQGRARGADLGMWGPPCNGDTTKRDPGVAPARPPADLARRPARSCNPNYDPCIPNSSTDLDCGDLSVTVRVVGADVYRLDGDGDGWGCE